MHSKELLIIITIVILFVGVSIATQYYQGNITKLVQIQGIWGAITYVGITIIAIVIAPISTMPLIPVATAIWGPVIAALLSIIGWTIGAIIAFMLARTYGRPLVRHFVNLDTIKRVEKIIPKENIFVTVLFLRMGLPVDVLSYALGLFSTMSLRSYTLATLLGVSPFAFVFAYAAKWPITYQLVIGVLAISIAIYSYTRYK